MLLIWHNSHWRKYDEYNYRLPTRIEYIEDDEDIPIIEKHLQMAYYDFEVVNNDEA